MPITQSAKKALRQEGPRRQRNLQLQRAIKTRVKTIRGLVADKKQADAVKLLPETYKALDKAAKHGLIHWSTADRSKARITKLVQKKV